MVHVRLRGVTEDDLVRREELPLADTATDRHTRFFVILTRLEILGRFERCCVGRDRLIISFDT